MATMATKNPQTQTQIQTTEQIMRQIIDMLKLDADMRERVREAVNDDRFVMEIDGEEIIMTIGPIECGHGPSTTGLVGGTWEGYADVALTAAEAIALAIRLIKKATELAKI
jgi:uncharacterized protein YPO0396